MTIEEAKKDIPDFDSFCRPFGDSGCAFNPKSVEIIGNVYDRKEAYND